MVSREGGRKSEGGEPGKEEKGREGAEQRRKLRGDSRLISECRASLLAQWQRLHLPAQETWVLSPGREDPLEKGMATHSSVLALKTHGQRSLVGYSPWGHKLRIQLSD